MMLKSVSIQHDEKRPLASMCRIPLRVQKELTIRHTPPRRFHDNAQQRSARSMVNFGWAGSTKRTFHSFLSEDATRRQFGQDCAVQKIMQDDDSTVVMLGILDGHGVDGGRVSGRCAEHAIDFLQREYHGLVEAVSARSESDIFVFCRRLYAEMEALRIPAIGDRSGSTCTLAFVVSVDGRMVIINSNVGDSPAGLVKDGVWMHLYTDHSPDNMDEYRLYRRQCANPGDAVYARINCGGWRMVDADGGYDPIPVFTTDESGDVIIHHRNALHMESRQTGLIGGNQSVRKMIFEEFRGSEWVVAGVLPDHYGTNFGSTIEGTSQMTRSLKDSAIKEQWGISAEPDVAIYELAAGEECAMIIGSDGFTDLFYFSELAELYEELSTTNDAGSAIASGMLECALKKAETLPNLYPLAQVRNEDGTMRTAACWDDVSVLVCRFRH